MEREQREQCDVAPFTDMDSPKCMPLLDLDTLKNPTSTAEDSSDGDDEQPNSAERLIDLMRHDSDSESEGEDGEPAGAVDLLLRRASTDAARLRALLDEEDGDDRGGGGDAAAAPSLEDLLELCEAPARETGDARADLASTGTSSGLVCARVDGAAAARSVLADLELEEGDLTGFVCPECLMTAESQEALCDHYASSHSALWKANWKDWSGRADDRDAYRFGDVARVLARALGRAEARTRRRFARRVRRLRAAAPAPAVEAAAPAEDAAAPAAEDVPPRRASRGLAAAAIVGTAAAAVAGAPLVAAASAGVALTALRRRRKSSAAAEGDADDEDEDELDFKGEEVVEAEEEEEAVPEPEPPKKKKTWTWNARPKKPEPEAVEALEVEAPKPPPPKKKAWTWNSRAKPKPSATDASPTPPPPPSPADASPTPPPPPAADASSADVAETILQQIECDLETLARDEDRDSEGEDLATF